MEDQDHPGQSENLINSSPNDTPLADNTPDPAPSPSRSSGEAEGKTTVLTEPSGQTGGLTPPEIKAGSLRGESRPTKRLSEAFWEGVSSAKPGGEKKSPTREAPPAAKDRKPSTQPALMDWLLQSGKSAAESAGKTASGWIDSVANLAKTGPSIPTKWGEAFREGAAKVRTGAVKPKAVPVPPPAGSPTVGGKGVWDSLSQIGDSAAGFVRDALLTFKPGEAGEIEKQIRLGEKRIRDLYLEIGREAADSWSREGMAETEKVQFLLEEFKKQEETIQKLKSYSSEIAAAKKTGGGGSPAKVPEARVTPEKVQENLRTEVEMIAPPAIQEVIPPEVPLSTPTAAEPTGPGDRQGPERPEEAMIPSVTPGAESLAVPPTTEERGDDGLAGLEEAVVGTDQNPSPEPEGNGEKTEGVPEKKKIGDEE